MEQSSSSNSNSTFTSNSTSIMTLSDIWKNLAHPKSYIRHEALFNVAKQTTSEQTTQNNTLYIIKRLIQMLQSQRLAARQGAAAALEIVMKNTEKTKDMDDTNRKKKRKREDQRKEEAEQTKIHIETDKIMQLAQEELRITGENKENAQKDTQNGKASKHPNTYGQGYSRAEARCASIAHVILWHVLIRSGRLHDIKPNTIHDHVKVMIAFGTQTPQMRETVFSALTSLIERLTVDQFKEARLDDVMNTMLINVAPEKINIDQLALADALTKFYAKYHLDNPLPKSLQKQILPASIQLYCRALVESTFTHPHIHCYWASFVRRCSDNDDAFSTLWQHVVESELFAEKSTIARKNLGLNIVILALDTLPTGNALGERMKLILSRVLLRIIVNNVTHKQNQLHDLSETVRNKIIDVACVNRSIALIMLHRFIDFGRKFDMYTKTNTVRQLAALLTDGDAESYVCYLINLFINVVDSDKPVPVTDNTNSDSDNVYMEILDDEQQTSYAEATQLWCIEQLFSLCKHSILSRSEAIVLRESWLSLIIDFLVFRAFFNPLPTKSSSKMIKKSGKKYLELLVTAPANDAGFKVHEMAYQRLVSLLMLKPAIEVDDGQQCKNPKIAADNTNPNNNSAKNDNAVWLQLIHESVLLFSEQGFHFREILDDNAILLRQQCYSCIKRLGNLAADASVSAVALKTSALKLLMLHLMLLHLHDAGFTTPLLNDLLQVCDHAFPSIPTKSDRKQKKSKLNAEHLPFMPVLTDILLALLVRPSELFRQVAKRVFASFIVNVDSSTVQTLIDALKRKNSAVSADDENSDDFQSDDESSDVDDNHDSSFENNESTSNRSLKLRKSISNADQNLDVDSDEESGNQIDEDDAFSNDSITEQKTMRSYNDHLSNIVRLRREKMKARKELDLQSLHFKLRVQDLIEVLLKKCDASALTLTLIELMPEAIDASRSSKVEAPLKARLLGFYKNKLVKNKNFPICVPDQAASISTQVAWSELLRLLNSLLEKTKSCHRETSAALSHAILFVIRVALSPSSQIDQQEALETIAAIYRKCLIGYFTDRRSRYKLMLFIDLETRYPQLAWRLADVLLLLARAPPGHPISLEGELVSCSNFFVHAETFMLLRRLLSHRSQLGDDVKQWLSISAEGVVDSVQQALQFSASKLAHANDNIAVTTKSASSSITEEIDDSGTPTINNEGKLDSGINVAAADFSVAGRITLKAKLKRKRREKRRREEERNNDGVLALHQKANKQDSLQVAKVLCQRLKEPLKFFQTMCNAYVQAKLENPAAMLYPDRLHQSVVSLPAELLSKAKRPLSSALSFLGVSLEA